MKASELFGARVKSIRERKGWTQEVLAEKIEISTNYLSCIERGKENPTFDMLERLSAGLQVEMWELFEFGHEKNVKDLRANLRNLSNELSDEKLRLAVKLFRSLAR